MSTFGEHIRALRKARRWSYKRASDELGISQTYLYRIEAESMAPSEDTIRAFANVFAEDYDDLMFLSGRMPSDCEAIVTADATMPAFLRWAARKGWSGERLYAVLRALEPGTLPESPPNGEKAPGS